MNQNVQKLHDDMYETIDDFVNEQCTYFSDENNCKFRVGPCLVHAWSMLSIHYILRFQLCE